jgi:hypothetical protein
LYRYLLGNVFLPVLLVVIKYLQENVLMKHWAREILTCGRNGNNGNGNEVVNMNDGMKEDKVEQKTMHTGSSFAKSLSVHVFWMISRSVLAPLVSLISSIKDVDVGTIDRQLAREFVDSNGIEMNPMQTHDDSLTTMEKRTENKEELQTQKSAQELDENTLLGVNLVMLSTHFQSISGDTAVLANSKEDLDSAPNALTRTLSTAVASMTMLQRKQRDIFNGKQFVILMVSDVVLLLSFGTIFPMIAIVVCISIYVHSWQTQRLVHRYVNITEQIKEQVKNCKDPVLQKQQESLTIIHTIQTHLISQCQMVQRLLIRSLRMITFVAGVFWSFFLFDILGDEVGFVNALWILFVMSLFPIFLWMCTKLYVVYCTKKNFVEEKII